MKYTAGAWMLLVIVFTLFFVAVRLSGEEDRERIEKASKDFKPMKLCIRKCIRDQFKNFHHSGDSWGTSSSSMNGLSQEKIYIEVQNYCKEFYKGEKCCSGYGIINGHAASGYGICRRKL